MRRRSWLSSAGMVAAALWLVAQPTRAAVIEGVEFADQVSASDSGDPVLRLYSMGLLRYRVVFRGYVAALYLPEGVSSAGALGDVPRRLELSYFWSIAGDDFGRAADQLLRQTLPAAELTSLRSRIDTMHRAYRDVSPNDRYSLTYIPGTGTELRLNGKLLVTVPGADFARAYFGLWLGAEPLDVSLRDALMTAR